MFLNQTQDSSDYELVTSFKRETEMFMGFIFLLFAIVGTLGNSATLLVMFRARRLYNCCTPYLFSITLCDLIQTVLIVPVLSMNAITGKAMVPKTICKLISMIYHYLMSETWVMLAFLSIIRCVAIWTGERSFILEWTRTLVAVSWIPPSIGILTGLYFSFRNSGHTGMVCSFFCGFHGIPSSVDDEEANLNTSRFIRIAYHTFVAVPLSAMILSYVLIYFKIWKSQRSLNNLGMAAFNKHQNDVRYSQMILCIFVSVFVSFLAPSLLEIYRCSKVGNVHFKIEDDVSLSLPEWFYVIVYIGSFVPFLSNPLIFVASNRDYRRAYERYIFGKKDALIVRSSFKHSSDRLQSARRSFHSNNDQKIVAQNQKPLEFHLKIQMKAILDQTNRNEELESDFS